MSTTLLFPYTLNSPSYRPFRSSPLAVRDVNRGFSMSDQATPPPKSSGQYRKPIEDVTNTFSRRYQENIDPLGQIKSRASQRTGREALRKKMGQNRSESRDSERFEARGEQVLRMDWVEQRRSWEEDFARRAPEIAIEDEEQSIAMAEEELPDYIQPPEDEEDLGALMLCREVENLSDGSSRQQRTGPDHPSAFDEFSDDEAYDLLFLEALNQRAQSQSSMDEAAEGSADGQMDMSLG